MIRKLADAAGWFFDALLWLLCFEFRIEETTGIGSPLIEKVHGSTGEGTDSFLECRLRDRL